ncbi:hypothetical protein L228DRAFT_283117 [Xylona heveae TC161]|uniref:Putative zinc-finger domain-containing protein n=1 Tax=Xylona heveae (strain CBS 132557 / TC161) TaxID=1328760 RepID=A0A165H6N2_XYLHT|nr:hypothetical protein L228DRAFT_283117 [Xylona heveae TC161]KZF23059.1 hypothetical protein L228DRAFT_283117 [Xylona heveae TC161]
MSNYPPTPSFGVPFSLGSGPSSASTLKSNLPPNAKSNVPHVQDQAFTAFQHNNGLPPLNFQPFGHAAPPLPLFPPLPNGTLPPPPYPPVPIPPPQGFPLPPPPVLSNPRFPLNVPPPPFPNTPPFSMAPFASDTLAAKASIIEREEGELSEAEGKQEQRSNQGTAAVTGPTPIHSPAQPVAQSAAPHRENLPPKPAGFSPAVNGSSATGTLYPPEHPLVFDGEVEDSSQKLNKERPPFSLSVKSNLAEPSASPVSVTSGNVLGLKGGKTLTEKRTAAKNALLNLIPFKIKFSELVAENIDPEILRSLYDEIGLKHTPQTPTRLTADGAQGTSPDKPERSRTRESTQDSRTIHESQELPSNKGEETANPSIITTMPPKPLDSSQQKVVVQSKTADQAQPTANRSPPTAQPSKPAKLPVPPKFGMALSTGENAGEPKLERKDYIARMLAAKKSKQSSTIPRPPSNESQRVSTRSEVTADKQVRKEPDAPDEGSKEKSKSQIEAELEEKKRAQTELARQRIEALKNQKNREKGLSTASGTVTPIGNGLSPNPTPLQAQPPSLPESASIPQISSLPTPPIHHALPPKPAPVVEDTSKERKAATVSGIPGLFMTASEIAPSTVQLTESSTTTSSPALGAQDSSLTRRKRPVASDFDSETSLNQRILKRPFGRNGTHQVVIDVSDDDTGSDADDSDSMDIDDKNDSDEATAGTDSKSSEHASFRNMPPLTDTPTRPTSTRSGIILSSPASAQPFNTRPLLKNKEPEHLKRKMEEIEGLQKKIAEMEQKWRAKQASSRPQTPGTLNNSSNPFSLDKQTILPSNNNTETSPPAESSTASPESDLLPSAITSQADTHNARAAGLMDSVKASDAISSEQLKQTLAAASAEVRLESLDSKLRRRAEITSGIPAVDAAVRTSQLRLEELKKEMEAVAAAVQAGLERRKRLADELESLGIDTEGMPVEELQSKKIEIERQGGNGAEPAAPNGESVSDIKTPPAEPQAAPLNNQMGSTARDGETNHVQPRSPFPVNSNHSTADQSLVLPTDLPSDDDSGGDAMDTSGSSGDEGEVAEDVHTDHTSPVREAENQQNFAEIPSPLSADVKPQAPQQSMSAEDISSQSIESNTSEDEDMEDADSSEESTSSESSDEYEPPEVVTPAGEPENEADTSSFSPSSAIESPKAVEEADEEIATVDDKPENANLLARDSADVTQIPPPNLPAENETEANRPETVLPEPWQFTPYESPLKLFKAYRYHPNYTHDVPRGFRSLTYSHHIDMDNPMCPFETAGGVCNDSSCDFQHFRDMNLSDDMILVQMGAAQEGQTQEERQHYVEGLKQVIHDMRGRNVNDFNIVASELAAYRSRFLNDKSRVLSL